MTQFSKKGGVRVGTMGPFFPRLLKRTVVDQHQLTGVMTQF